MCRAEVPRRIGATPPTAGRVLWRAARVRCMGIPARELLRDNPAAPTPATPDQLGPTTGISFES